MPGLVPDDIFFEHLSKRRFPAGNFIRAADSLDYIEQPDVFHDVFGHVPLLAQPAVADFMQAMGAEGLAALEAGALHRLARLYWYSVEFGLAREEGETRIYGAGLLSSFGESRFALDSPEPRRAPLRSQAGAAHPLPLRRLPAGLFRDSELRCAAAPADDAELAALYAELAEAQRPRSLNVLVDHVDLAHAALLAGGVDEAAELLAALLRLLDFGDDEVAARASSRRSRRP